MKNFLHPIFLSSGVVFHLIALAIPVYGQISSDNTIPTNINSAGNLIEITGGTEAGNNLFHSFQEFSVLSGETAYFNNPETISNIISRVTGGSISNINGLIRANGGANLFLINPAGIIFGENARLDIGGSFLGSTADSIVFQEGEFSATDTQTPPLLIINAPIGLRFREAPGKIVNQSRVEADSELIGRFDTGDLFTAGLQVMPGKTLALVGGDIVLDGGNLTANGGRIELGSVDDNSLVGISSTEQGLIINYDRVENFKDISLLSGTIVDTSGEVGGEIQLQGKQVILTSEQLDSDIPPVLIFSNTVGEGKGGTVTINATEIIGLKSENIGIWTEAEGAGIAGDLNINTNKLTLQDGSFILSNAILFEQSQAGNIEINASESVDLIGTSSSGQSISAIVSIGFDTGSAGDINLNTERLIATDGGQIGSLTFGEGDAGNVTISAQSIELSRRTSNNISSGIFAQVEEGATGNGGNLSIETEKLTILDGAQISTSARNDGQGGNININASDSILLSGFSPFGMPEEDKSGVFVSAEPGATQNAGTLEINTGQLIVENGARISADNRGTGEGGKATLNVNQLIVRDGGEIGAGSLVDEDAVDDKRGAGGTLNINATESVEVSGTSRINEETVESSIFTLAEGTGDAGDLIINTPNLTVQDGGEITARSLGTGDGGDITFTGEELTLNNGSITASTASTQGGNITLNLKDNLRLINDGEITASAGTAEAPGDGGNVAIDSNFILAFPTDNTYQITANAFEGDGGSIAIATNSIFGRESINISASSQFGLDGEIAIDTPDVDPIQGLINLTTAVIDPSQLISRSCLAGDRETAEKASEFIVTGRGGLPPSPNETLKGNAMISPEWVAIDSLDTSNELNRSSEAKRTDNLPKLPEIIRATGWVRNANGKITLVAENPHAVSSSSSVNYPRCQ